jgi:hypothetical protein
MDAHEFNTLEQVRGRIDGSDANDLTERANYIRTLQSWTS